MPYPKEGETKQAYISRCIPYMIENEGKEKDQAAAMCYAFWDEYGPDSNESIESRIDKVLGEHFMSRPTGHQYPGAPSTATEIRCNECGKKFKKKIGKNTYEVKCPKCGSYDTEPV